MKKRFLAATMAMAMVFGLTGCDGGSIDGSAASSASQETSAETSEGDGSETDAASGDGGEFNPDQAEDAMSIEELRAANGEEVPVAAGITLGAVEKSLSNEFWRTLEEGYEKAAENVNAAGIDLKIEVKATTDESDETGQQTMTETLTSQGVQALMLSPISDSNLTAAVESAKEANVPVFNVNDGLIATADYYVGPNAYMNGQLAAEWCSEKLGDEGQVAIVIGMAKAFAARERTAGFKDWIADNDSKLEIVAEQNADWDRTTAKNVASTWIQQYPDLKAIFCNNDDMALGVVEAVREAEADILVVGVDGIGEAYESIRNGGLDATIDSFPYYMAQVATECALRALAGQELPSVVATPQALIDSENVDMDGGEIIGWTDTVFVAK